MAARMLAVTIRDSTVANPLRVLPAGPKYAWFRVFSEVLPGALVFDHAAQAVRGKLFDRFRSR